jgi:hypothetical protein
MHPTTAIELALRRRQDLLDAAADARLAAAVRRARRTRRRVAPPAERTATSRMRGPRIGVGFDGAD